MLEVPCATVCSALLHIVTEIILKPVRRGYKILFVTQNKGHHRIEGRRNLSMDGICAACHVKLSQVNLMLQNRGVPSIWRNLRFTHYLYCSSCSVLLRDILLSHLVSSFSYWDPEGTLHHISQFLTSSPLPPPWFRKPLLLAVPQRSSRNGKLKIEGRVV